MFTIIRLLPLYYHLLYINTNFILTVYEIIGYKVISILTSKETHLVKTKSNLSSSIQNLYECMPSSLSDDLLFWSHTLSLHVISAQIMQFDSRELVLLS